MAVQGPFPKNGPCTAVLRPIYRDGQISTSFNIHDIKIITVASV